MLETDKEMMKEKIRVRRAAREGEREKGGELRVILGLRNDDAARAKELIFFKRDESSFEPLRGDYF